MSDKFLKVARQEIQAELDSLEQVLSSCNNDEHIFKNSQSIESHLHKIKGLAPMMGQDKIGEIARASDILLKHIMGNGTLNGSYVIIVEAIDKMKQLLSGQNIYDMDNFTDKIRSSFPDLVDL